MLAVGQVAPDIVGVDADQKTHQLSLLRGKPCIVYFYPKDETPGCTKEACAFRDAFGAFTDAGVTIFGVSSDSAQSHRKFQQTHRLPFPLVADESQEVQKAYGVSSRLGFASRVTFLIDKEGRVARVWPNVNPVVHAREVLDAVHSRPAD